jgi:hypothetical protein
LRAHPNNGRANLLAARSAVQKGKIPDAESYYQRAIYGVWNENAPAHRIDARLELTNLLASRGSEKELLAELLPLEGEAANDNALLQRIAHLYLSTGSPARSATTFRALIQNDPANEDAHAGLGQAEFSSRGL